MIGFVIVSFLWLNTVFRFLVGLLLVIAVVFRYFVLLFGVLNCLFICLLWFDVLVRFVLWLLWCLYLFVVACLIIVYGCFGLLFW